MRVRLMLAALLIGVSTGCGDSSPSAPDEVPAGSGTPVSISTGAAGRTTTAYSPNPITVTVGSTVTWTNSDALPHTSTADGGSWNSGVMAPGGTFSRTFPSAGSFPYHCTIHAGMVGTVTVQ